MTNPKFLLLSELLSFLRHPSSDQSVPHTRSAIIKRIMVLISWLYVVVIPLALLINYLLELLHYEGVNAVGQFAGTGDFWMILLLGGIVAPFIEELTFRLPLRFKPGFLALSVFFAVRIILTFFSRFYWPKQNFTLALWSIPLLLGLLVFTILRKPRVKERMQRLYDQRFGWIFYLSTILFGLMHITNYSEVQNILVIVILLGMPQLIVGLVLGFVRIKHGFWYGFLMHGLYNSLLLVPASLARYEGNQAIMTVAGIFGIGLFFLIGHGLITLIYACYLRLKYARA